VIDEEEEDPRANFDMSDALIDHMISLDKKTNMDDNTLEKFIDNDDLF
jgi:hypothetical protein